MNNGTDNLPAASGVQSTHSLILSERRRTATPADFARIVGPALTLVAPTGMTQDERKTWAHAARKALGDLTIGQLEDGAREAIRTVDHPSKIVPAIRKAMTGGYKSFTSSISPPAPVTNEPLPDQDEVASLIRGLRERLEAKS